MAVLKARPRRDVAAVLGAFCVALGVAVAPDALAQGPSEHQVKAAFLFNFARFVGWPPGSFSDPGAPYQLCVVGQDSFGADLEATIGKKTVNGRSFRIVRVNDPRDLTGPCHIVFETASEADRPLEVLKRVGGEGVLTVSEIEGFAELGGVINFVLVDQKIRLEINVDAAERAKLQVSSQLLKLARVVHTGGR